MTSFHSHSKGTTPYPPTRTTQNNTKLLTIFLNNLSKGATAMIPTDDSLPHNATTLPKHLIKNRIPMPSHTSVIPVPKPSQPEAS